MENTQNAQNEWCFACGRLNPCGLKLQFEEEGDTYIEAKALLERTIILLESARQIELDPALVAKELTNLIQEDKVQNIETKIFDNTLYFAEQGIYTHLSRIMKDQPDISAEDKIQASLERVEDELGITYDKVQKDDVLMTLEAMKIEYSIRAPFDGIVASSYFQAGDQVKAGDELVEFEALTEEVA